MDWTTDWNAVIEKKREALKRILATLVAMVGLDVREPDARGQFTFFPQEGAPLQGVTQAEKSKLSPALTLPRRVHSAVLRLLRPAESAARRLIIVAACYTSPLACKGAALPPQRARKPPPLYVRSVITMVAGVRTRMVWQPGATFPKLTALPPKPATARIAFPLFDTLRNPFRLRRKYVPAHAAPRICVPGVTERHVLPPPPSQDDPLNATRLGLRLQALASVLDDLPAQARRFVRWRARREAEDAARKQGQDSGVIRRI